MFPVYIEGLLCINDVLLVVNSSINFLIYRQEKSSTAKPFLCHALYRYKLRLFMLNALNLYTEANFLSKLGHDALTTDYIISRITDYMQVQRVEN